MDEIESEGNVSAASAEGSPEAPRNMERVVKSICRRLKVTAYDVERVLRAKELLSWLQRRKAFINLFGLDDDDVVQGNPEDFARLTSIHSLKILSRFSPMCSVSEDLTNEDISEDMCQLPFEEERWGNFFTGFQILDSTGVMTMNENRKCIELTTVRSQEDFHTYLLSGIRCFLLDLFIGPLQENQDLIVQLREAEIAVSKEYGFPVVSTIFAKLSPRYQYTGYLSPRMTAPVEMKKGFKVMLTTDRSYSRMCTSQVIYVNARFLLFDLKEFDIILLGDDIQLMVRSVRLEHVYCCVCRPGILQSFMPVLFPARCSRFRVSYEEIEDLTFAREVGINVVVSYISGSVAYVDDMEKVMSSLQCDGLRLYTRVVLNEMKGCDGELNWIAERYDGFIVELANPENIPDILRLCPNAECFMQQAYAAKKPILLDAWTINEENLRVDPSHYYYAFYYPDKYVFKSDNNGHSFYFSFLQSAIFDHIAVAALSKMPHCDASHTGADGLARAIVAASMEVQAKVIVVCGVTTRMVQKISHFRPQASILFVSHMRSAEDYVSLYHNVTMLSFRTKSFRDHRRNIFRKAVFGLAYLASRQIAKHGEHIVLVYNSDTGTTFPEKYLIYKFDKLHFVEHLSASLFPTAQNFFD
ncbi:pyruvate kinase [Drosophila nasuta]|uniref:pyruvate kinase n=1 Tax=Drosophila nasuta TaxID=42062 RepID=UPI00295EC244|nr:pyruvate kinase [Drosophila nasuta]